jgi:glutamate-ammonia-ligase adenylyltransferase
MGSLGAGRLNAVSDLDLILIYDAQGQEASDGPRPLTTTAYYARLTKALITALSAPMAEGRLYEVDMRLRPSGRQGPVATALSAFAKYQREDAWTWEHLALTRARPVAGDAGLGADVEDLRRAILAEKSGGAGLIPDTAEMRARTLAARPGGGRWDVKAGPGRMQEIELVAQAAGLRAGSARRGVEAQLDAGVRAGWPGRAEAEVLLAASRLCWRVHCAGRLLADGVPEPENLGAGACAFLLREAGADNLAALEQRIDASTAAAAAVVRKLLSSATDDTAQKHDRAPAPAVPDLGGRIEKPQPQDGAGKGFSE